MFSVHIFLKSEYCEQESYEGPCYVWHKQNTQSFITELITFLFQYILCILQSVTEQNVRREVRK
jgi:hypothetical protein